MITRIAYSEEKSDYDFILKSLITFNSKYLDKTQKGESHFYVLKNGSLLAGMSTAYRGGWAEIIAFDYETEDALNYLMASVCRHFKGLVQGITYMTFDPQVLLLLEAYDFKTLGTIADKPRGYTFHEISNQTMTYQAVDSGYDLVVGDMPHPQYDPAIQTAYEKRSKDFGGSHVKEDLMFVAKEGDRILGGVIGYVRHDYLYVSVLWVDQTLRGRRLGTRLMEQIETAAKAKGIANAWLGTASFQAKPFYERIGYEVAYTIDDCPRGYKNHTMIKKL